MHNEQENSLLFVVYQDSKIFLKQDFSHFSFLDFPMLKILDFLAITNKQRQKEFSVKPLIRARASSDTRRVHTSITF